MQLVSGKAEFKARQVSLLWHNSFLVSLWTVQPTLIYFTYMIHVHILDTHFIEFDDLDFDECFLQCFIIVRKQIYKRKNKQL